MTSIVEVAGGRYEYVEIPAARDGRPPLVLLHEGLGSVSMWRDFPYQLAAVSGARTLAYSRLGFGRSGARRTPWSRHFVHEEAREDLPALREALGIERPVLVGHSTGGSIALAHAAHDAGGVAGVVAIAPLVDVEPGNLESIREARRIFETTAWSQKLAPHHEHPMEQVFAGWNDTWLDPGFRDWSIAAELRALRCPVLALGGEDDPYSSPRQLELIRENAGGPVEVLLLPHCGHVPYRDEPQAVLAAIGAFVERLP